MARQVEADVTSQLHKRAQHLRNHLRWAEHLINLPLAGHLGSRVALYNRWIAGPRLILLRAHLQLRADLQFTPADLRTSDNSLRLSKPMLHPTGLAAEV